ncbi:FAD dependent oxidoreductase [Purpureocillium lavendulum]|uniref:FAD dependent oxidoreductase n=1 Tax=Purpureocillium lavendulum TaxID=1247861 RepID=A0AB34FM76_9HYPO|nr:FAD dependent oxidoreductase [Purpureocillium lavendulum]
MVLLLGVVFIAQAAPSLHSPHKKLPHRLIHQFPKGRWIENIAIRPNGNLLLTSIAPSASVYEIVDPLSASPMVKLSFTIDSVTSLMGIAEVSRDTFAIVGGNFSSKGGVKGSVHVWTANYTNSGTPAPQKKAFIPDAVLPNGATAVPGHEDSFMFADSTLGSVWIADLATGKSKISQHFPENESGSDKPLAIGVNGLHIRKGHLWWTNSAQQRVYKVRVDANGHTAFGARVEPVATIPALTLDDFTIGPGQDDIIWAATGDNNTMVAAGPNACKFGRGPRDYNILYVTTAGQTINGTSMGGRVEALDINGFDSSGIE